VNLQHSGPECACESDFHRCARPSIGTSLQSKFTEAGFGEELTVTSQLVNSGSQSVTQAWGCQRRRWTRSFLRSLPPNRRAIVESHGGQLWASANSGGGAIFHFTQPIQVTESSPLVA